MDKYILVDLKQIPFVRLLLPYILGVSIAYYWPSGINVTIKVSIALISAFGLFYLLLKKHKSSLLNLGILFNLILLLMGIVSFRQVSYHPVFPDGKTEYSGIVGSKPEIRNSKIRFVCQLINYRSENRDIHIRDKILIYSDDTSSFQLAAIGDSVKFSGKLQAAVFKGNPGEFNFSNYLAIQQIKYVTFLKGQDLQLGENSGKYALRRIASSLQVSIQERLIQYSFEGDELAIISALVTGDKERLDVELKSEYAAAGGMHILAISGLHVGILYLFLGLIFKDRNKRWFYRILRMSIILLAIWSYAFLAGLTPSVLRASVMFSLLLIGKSINRSTNSFNILAASAMLILIINPYELFKVGFQLSYFAVFGILFFQPRLVNLLAFKNLIPDRIWQLLTLSIATQLATLPLSLYYFHQFPVYFWLTNLVIIPAVWLIMIITVLFFCLLPVHSLAALMAIVLSFLLKTMNLFVEWISKLPHAVLNDIRFDQFHLVYTILILFITVVLLRFDRKRGLLFLAGIAIAVYIGIDTLLYTIDEKKQEILIYNIPDRREISIVVGHKHLVLSDSIGSPDTSINNLKYPYYWKSRQISKHISRLCLNSLADGTKVMGKGIQLEQQNGDLIIQINNYCLCILNNTNKPKNKTASHLFKQPVRDILISNKSGYPSSDNINCLIPARIILTGRMPYKQYKSWLNYATDQNIQLININQTGTLHYTLPSISFLR